MRLETFTLTAKHTWDSTRWMFPAYFRDSHGGLSRSTLLIGRKRERPDYKSYGHDKYALRCAKCALGEGEELKIQVAYGGETSRNSAAHLRLVGKQPIGAG